MEYYEHNNVIESFCSKLLGLKISHFLCEVNLLEFVFFNSPLILHVCGFGRVIRNGDIIVTTYDYLSWDGVDENNNDEWFNVVKFNNEVVGGVVESVEIKNTGDLIIKTDNEIVIECLVANAYPHFDEDNEQWALFEHLMDGHGVFLQSFNKTLMLNKPHESEIVVRHRDISFILNSTKQKSTWTGK